MAFPPLSGVVLAYCVLASRLPGQEGQSTIGPQSTPYTLKGVLEMKYVGRTRGGAHDNDLFGFLDARVGEARKHLVTGRFSGRVSWDMDRDHDPSHPFRTYDDRRSNDVTGRFYSAYVDVNPVEDNALRNSIRRVRLGRQVLSDTPQSLFLDGLSVKTQPATEWGDLIVGAYVGVPSHIFESSPSEDIAAGGSIQFAPWDDATLRLDYMHVRDDYLAVTSQDDLVGVRIDQRIGDGVFGNAYANLFDFDTLRDLGGFLSWTDADSDFSVTVRYTGLISDEKRRSIDFDYFTEILGTYFSYDQYELNLHKGIGESLYVEGGAQRRELTRDSREGLFNHDFSRYYATTGVDDLPWSGTDVSGTFELWDSGGDRFTSFGGDISHEFDKKLSLSLGTLFELYRYDALRGKENENTQVSYARFTYRLTEKRRLRTKFEFEDGETDQFFTWSLSMRVRF